jgi:RimJ/RimL family protein N-acetyltransferase
LIPHPTQLEDEIVVLRPLATGDLEGLLAQAQEDEMWQFFRTGSLRSAERMKAWIDEAIEARGKGIDYPFVTVDRQSGQVAGSTRFRLMDSANRSVEIGGTWLGAPFRGTGINRHAKYLMLRYAFEEMGVVRVQFRTDLRNLRSQRAIEQLGAVREGVLRKDFIYADGYQRSSVFYSITEDEWPELRLRLVR